MRRFEATSVAILFRNEKSKVLGIGTWKDKEELPEEVYWLKVVKQLKVFGFIICPTYQETVKKAWEKVVSGFEKVLHSWASRSLDTLSQRVEVSQDICSHQTVLCRTSSSASEKVRGTN